MTDYQLLGESLHREWRPAGEPTWLELDLQQKIFWQQVAVAADYVITPELLDTWCPDCDDYRDDLRKSEDRIQELEDECDGLQKKLERAQESKWPD